jgi:hypothetical protein
VRRLPAGIVGLSEAEEEIRQELLREADDRAYAEVLEQAWTSYTVEIARTNLPFAVQEDLAPSRRGGVAQE